MTEPTITCPKCKTEIKLTESLAAPLIESTRQEYIQLIAKKDADVAKREGALRKREEALTKEKQAIEEQVAERLQEERQKLSADMTKREGTLRKREEALAKEKQAIEDQIAEKLEEARKSIAVEEAKKAKRMVSADLDAKAKELNDLQDVLKQRDKKLAEAQKAEAELLRKQRKLDDEKRELDLTVEKRIQEGLEAIRTQARKEAEESLNLKVLEKEQTITSMKKQIEELKRKAEQGSQQLQGEVQELELEELLTTRFPMDQIVPVPKGEFGGDVLHNVMGPFGQPCGTILWESKRTKNWSDGWLTKLRDDQRAAKADIAIIISHALPKHIETFDFMEGIWVTHPKSALPVALSLRHTLMEVSSARKSSEGQQTKKEMVYEYLTGPRFRQRVQAIAEAFTSMQEDLEREKKAITKQWAKREAQLERVVGATVGMYGDLQGIAGRSLLEIDELSLLEYEGE